MMLTAHDPGTFSTHCSSVDLVGLEAAGKASGSTVVSYPNHCQVEEQLSTPRRSVTICPSLIDRAIGSVRPRPRATKHGFRFKQTKRLRPRAGPRPIRRMLGETRSSLCRPASRASRGLYLPGIGTLSPVWTRSWSSRQPTRRDLFLHATDDSLARLLLDDGDRMPSHIFERDSTQNHGRRGSDATSSFPPVFFFFFFLARRDAASSSKPKLARTCASRIRIT